MEREEMKSFMEDFKKSMLRDMKDEIKNIVKNDIVPVVEKFKVVEKKVREQDLKIVEVEGKTQEHGTQIADLDLERRKRNIILFNVPDDEGENFNSLETRVLDIFNNFLRVPCNNQDIDFISRLGKDSSVKLRPVLVKMVTLRKKLEILRNRRNLKGSKINIGEDYSPEVRKKRKLLIPQLMALRKEGKTAELRQDRIIVREKIDREREEDPAEELNSAARNKRQHSSSPEAAHTQGTKKIALDQNVISSEHAHSSTLNQDNNAEEFQDAIVLEFDGEVNMSQDMNNVIE